MPTRPLTPDSLAQASLGTGRYAASPAVVSAIRQASNETGTRFETLLASAAIESGLNPSAKASTSSATGLFQFVDQTWLAAVKRSGAEHGLAAQAAAIVRRGDGYAVEDPALRQEILDLRKDPKVAAAMAGDHLRDLSASLTQSLGRTPDVTETYLAHFLGAGGAAQMLHAMQDTPARAASEVLPAAAAANPSLFNGQSVAQFIGKVRGRVEKAYSDLGLSVPQGALQLGGAASGAPSSDSGSDGWGNSVPNKLSTTPERLMLASLAEVFTRADKMANGGKAHHPGQQLPRGLMAGLATNT